MFASQTSTRKQKKKQRIQLDTLVIFTNKNLKNTELSQFRFTDIHLFISRAIYLRPLQVVCSGREGGP